MESHKRDDETREITNEDEISKMDQDYSGRSQRSGTYLTGKSRMKMQSRRWIRKIANEVESLSRKRRARHRSEVVMSAPTILLPGKDGRNSLEDLITESIESVNHEVVTRYRQLHISLLHNDWKAAADFIDKNPEALTAVISELSETFFHIIVESDQDGAIQLLRECLRKIQRESVESVLAEPNISGSTALIKAARVGNIEAAKLLVESNRNLLKKRNKQQLLPLHHGGISGHKETVKYLLSETEKEDSKLLAGSSGFELVNS